MNAPNEQTAAEVIREARNVLFERGWHRGGYSGRDESVCVRGAINVADHGYPQVHTQRSMRACDFVSIAIGMAPDLGQLAYWNDHVVESFDELIDVLDRAEKIAEAAS